MIRCLPVLLLAGLSLHAADSSRTVLKARASELDPSTKEHAEIGFVFGTAEKPQDLQVGSVDTKVKERGELVIWLMSYNDELFTRINSYGQHAIQVHYANKWFGKLCQPLPSSPTARGNIRLEAATGEDFSPELELSKPDGMMERARHFLIWLDDQQPRAGWDQFLTKDQSAVIWEKVIIAGASHGSTTAARFAQHQKVARVVMHCGPRDQDQDWQSGSSVTPSNRFFGFSHVLDGGWTGDHYCRSWELLGLHAYGPIVEVEHLSPPYGHSRRLISAADVGGNADKAHGSVSPGKNSPKDDKGTYLFEPVWEYLYTHPVDKVGEPVDRDPECYKSGDS